MAKIIIACDSTCDLSKELIEKLDIKIIPLIVNLDGKQYLDGVDITPDQIYASVKKKGKLPKTSAINVKEYLDFFAKIRKHEDDIILNFTISSKLSSTYQNSCMTLEFAHNIYTFDTQNLSTGIGLLLIEACRLRDANEDVGTIINKLEEYKKRIDASFVIDNLEYLSKGGRCSTIARFGANLLNIKPCIEVKNGTMGVGKQYRGKYEKTLVKYVNEKLSDLNDIDTNCAFITHAGVDKEIVDAVYQHVKSYNIFKNIYITRAGATISCHCGKDTLGLLFVRKSVKG